MTRTSFVAGNWKMNLNKAQAVDLARTIAKGAPANVQVGVAPPFVYIDAVAQALAGSPVLLARRMLISRRTAPTPAKSRWRCCLTSA